MGDAQRSDLSAVDEHFRHIATIGPPKRASIVEFWCGSASRIPAAMPTYGD